MSESETIENVMETVRSGAALPRKLQRSIADYSYELYVDSGGDPAVLIYVILTDKEVASPSFGRDAEQIREAIDEAIFESGVGRWPYVHFRSFSESKELAEAGA